MSLATSQSTGWVDLGVQRDDRSAWIFLGAIAGVLLVVVLLIKKA